MPSIRRDERSILTISGLTSGVAEFKGTCLSLPRLVAAGGITAEFLPDLSDAEHKSWPFLHPWNPEPFLVAVNLSWP